MTSCVRAGDLAAEGVVLQAAEEGAGGAARLPRRGRHAGPGGQGQHQLSFFVEIGHGHLDISFCM